ncbi:glucosaminidase domain-containing protein [Desulfatiferula olefinivorans]
MTEKPNAVRSIAAGLTAPVLFFMLCVFYPTPDITRMPAVFSDGPTVFSMPSFDTPSDAEARKSAFFHFLRPIIDSENRRIQTIRNTVTALAARGADQPLTPQEILWLTVLAEQYGLKPADAHAPSLFARLLKRVDTVPASLALAQAANESGWGSSRFARKGNNLFGQWTWAKGTGMVPKYRDRDKSHEVAKFTSINESVRSYIHNLNTHPGYRSFRALRQTMRSEGAPLSALALAEGLQSYSSKGKTYIKHIRTIIRDNEKHLNIQG